MSAEAAIIWMGFVFIAFIFTLRWIADVRDEAMNASRQASKIAEAMALQTKFNRTLNDHLDRLEDRVTSLPSGTPENHGSQSEKT